VKLVAIKKKKTHYEKTIEQSKKQEI